MKRGSEDKKSIKKDTITLSLDSNILDLLKANAQENRISVNSIINGILSKYVNFYKRAEEYGSAVIASTQFSVFIELMDEEKVTEIMQTDATATMIAHFQHNNIPIRLDTVIEIAFANVALISGVCTKFSQHRDAEGYRLLVFDHRYGIKWSRIISRVFSYLLKQTCNIETSAKLLPQTISIKILDRAWDRNSLE